MTDTNYQAMKNQSEKFFNTIKGALNTEKSIIKLDFGKRKVKIRKDNVNYHRLKSVA